ncbi:MAG: enoyl-[acyl-carrier-protein] reductase FabL [Candidatus Promineifilaceae bacterium]
MSDFANKVALVTGSGRGIGRSIAIRLAREGADIIVNFFRNREPAEETAHEITALGCRAIVVKANVGDLDQLAHLFEVAESEYGKLDILVHNAASGYLRPALEQKPRGWEWTMNINARSLLFGAQHAARLMQGNRGAIVAISSLGSIRVFPDYVVVGASKAALESLIRYLGVELSPLGITVNAISPGIVETDALQHFSIFAQEGQNILTEAIERTPVGRLCKPEDVADLVFFLCSPQATMICGQTIILDGGYSLHSRS